MLNRLKANILNSFEIKIILMMLFSSMIIVLLSVVAFISYYKIIEKEKYIETNTNILSSTVERLDDYIDQLSDDTQFIFYEQPRIISESNFLEDNYQYDKLLSKLLYIFNSREEICSIIYYYPDTEEGYVVNKNGNKAFDNASDIEEQDWYKELIKSSEKYILQPQHITTGYASRYELNDKRPVFSINRKFKSITGEESMVSVSYDLREVEKICQSAKAYNEENIQYVDKNGEIIYSSILYDEKQNENIKSISQSIIDEENIEGSFEYKDDKSSEETTIVYKRSPENGNILIKYIANDVLVARSREFYNVALIILFLFICMLIPFCIWLAKHFTDPLLKLEQHMVRVGDGDVTAKIEIQTTDEVGRISETFNQMMEKINRLVEEHYKIELAYKDAQLNSLIAQINPHFINNTLQSIGGVALQHDVEEVYTITNALGKMLRYSIKEGNIVTIKREIQNVRDYLYIQKFRHEDKLLYNINYDINIEEFFIPKLILQPLVENAIIHGLEPKKSPCNIIMNMEVISKYILIEITDDGIGIEKEKLELLQNRLNRDVIDDTSQSIGLLNVSNRIRLMFGENGKVILQSQINIGTKVIVKIPLITNK